ncbi:phosphotransferase family protein [Peribacillus kribbensis]|uniref:phosphotransferase family protein n=1 Tax=Peribacillus kribbensis TaxID=356658 RepID=UPI00042920E5|nr:aminoglycoside phosphotransferase family protein [Peribacillus kribbensis]
MSDIHNLIDRFNLKVASIHDVPESFSSQVFKLNLTDRSTVYVKIPYSKLKLERERYVLERLQDQLPLPKVLDYWEGNEEDTGALLLSAIPGSPISGKVNTDLAFDIGVLHAKLHAASLEEKDLSSPVSNEFTNWHEFIEEKFFSFAEDAKEVMDPELFQWSTNYFREHVETLPDPDGTCFIHMDFRPGNLLVQDNRVRGLIDFESARIGAVEGDFIKIHRDIFVKNPGTMEAYQKGYETIRPLIDLHVILPFYRFTDAFNSIGWCVRRGIHKNRAFLEENTKYLNGLFNGSK